MVFNVILESRRGVAKRTATIFGNSDLCTFRGFAFGSRVNLQSSSIGTLLLASSTVRGLTWDRQALLFCFCLAPRLIGPLGGVLGWRAAPPKNLEKNNVTGIVFVAEATVL